jgi:uncharacterized membrane protein
MTMTSVESMRQTKLHSDRDTLYIFSLVLVVLGLIISGYLSYVKLTEVPMVCVQNSDVFNCEVVQTSAYSRIGGIPIAWFGFATYVTLFLLLSLQNRIPFIKENGILVVFGITLFAWLYSMYLVYLQFFVLQALCPWCLAHEAVMTVLFIVSCLRLRKSMIAGK